MRPWVWRRLHPGIEIGQGVRIGRGCRLYLDPRARLVLCDRCEVDDGVTIAIREGGRVQLGSGCFVGHRSVLAAREEIVLGSGVFVAELVSIRDHDHTVGFPPSSGRMEVEPVTIEADAWLGAKVTVLRGARIGEGVVVGANAVVRGHLPAWSVCVGVPARVVRTYEPVGAGSLASPTL